MGRRQKNTKESFGAGLSIFSDKVHRAVLKSKNENQQKYIDAIDDNTVIFCVGPSGTGKTWISVAAAMKMLLSGKYNKIVITRPIVECGEHLGILPGEMEEKIHPYLVPILDVISEFLNNDELAKCFESGIIEICPLSVMRGRSMKDTIIIADEMQNANFKQMKMLLTRFGANSKLIISGDTDQSDLPGVSASNSPLAYCVKQLEGIEGISVTRMENTDIVRHPLITEILKRIGNG